MVEMNKNDMNMLMWKDKVGSLGYFSNSITKSTAVNFGWYYQRDLNFLYEILGGLEVGDVVLHDQKKGMKFKKQNDNCFLSVNNQQQIELNKTDMKEFIISLILIMEDILPLGSVVDLKKEYFTNEILKSKAEKVRMIITHRFLSKDGADIYFPYAGVVYPTGMLGRGEVLYFTPGLIEAVIYRGFEDIQEVAYVSQMKREYILEKNMISCGFVHKEKVEAFMGNGR
ncbi:hypothetical protein EDD66_103111 [Mobilisporobacter senegalensis]|uniref:DUF4176 domain-containing protein n=1 Tax=Mobilisporobacter senegalensis TaxID=1329262 RepID=A0A3N1XRA9_9FIRM|nr:DUF4176 domain-containing protein [Mobilisporobacter senegalensis]ROR29176.1 hypothetical protein EDD66_103111 [Mobilisporobacter senegalensis]